MTPQGNEVLTYATRSGTRQGVEAHVFRVELQRDLSQWSRMVVQTTHAAALLIKEISCGQYCISYQLITNDSISVENQPWFANRINLYLVVCLLKQNVLYSLP